MPSGSTKVPILRLAGPADAAALGRLHVAAWRETYQDLLPDGLLAGLSAEARGAVWERMLRDPAGHHAIRVHVAEREGELVGFAACGAQSDAKLAAAGFDGEIGAIYLRRAAQRHGLGRLLMRTAAADLKQREFQAASLWVLRENVRAMGFYERLGGIVVGEKSEVRPEGELVDIAYGWHDLSLLSA